VGDYSQKDANGSPAPWSHKGCMVRSADGEMVAYVQFERDRREISAAPLLANALEALMVDVEALAKILDPEGGVEGCDTRIPGLAGRYIRAYQAMNQARWRKT
jgi:hypothetical protein